MRRPIEDWRDSAAEITAEEYETKQDGARDLLCLVSIRIQGFPSNRLHHPDGPKLSLEVRPSVRAKRYKPALAHSCMNDAKA